MKKVNSYYTIIITHLISMIAVHLFSIIAACAESIEREYKEIAVTDGGSISGTVSFDGNIPQVELLYVNKDFEHCGKDPRPSPVLEVHPTNKGIKNVVVSIENISEGKPCDMSGIHPLLDQQRCTFTPHILVITAGTTIDFLNGDKIMHNVHSHCIKNQLFNIGTTFKQRFSERFDFVETVKISCDVHQWMSAWIVVKANPYFTITDKRGSFFIDDIPPGTYTIQAWHESLGMNIKEENISQNKESKVNFSFSRESQY